MPANPLPDAAALYQQYHRPVYAYLLRLTGSPEMTEELLQESFYRAIRGAAGYRGDASPLSWLCAIARNLWAAQAKRLARERDRTAPLDADRLTDPTARPEAVAERQEMRQRIARVLQALPETQRLALLLRDADGLPYETIAAMLGLSLANVKVTIHRARRRFRTLYQQEEGDRWHSPQRSTATSPGT